MKINTYFTLKSDETNRNIISYPGTALKHFTIYLQTDAGLFVIFCDFAFRIIIILTLEAILNVYEICFPYVRKSFLKVITETLILLADNFLKR